MVRQLKQLPSFNPGAAARLLTALQESQYSEEAKKLVAAAIDHNVISSPLPGGPMRMHSTKRKGMGYQYLHAAMTNYMTEKDITSLRCAKRSLANKTQVIVDRLARLGIGNPDEVTIAWGVGIVALSHFTAYPMCQTIFGMVHDMKERVNITYKIWPSSTSTGTPMLAMFVSLRPFVSCNPGL